MEPSWEEALDVDDSDLQSFTLLRPCKQQRRLVETTTTTTTFLCQTLDPSQSPSQTVNSPPRNFTSAYQAEVAEAPPSGIIPGPAGIVQAAMLRKTRDNGSFLGQEEPPMATQEYIRRAVEDPGEDDDFKRSPWLSATEFVNGDDMFKSVPIAPLGDIKTHLKLGKLDQVVAVIKSCAPNELGDLMVALKDPTGTISATIHHKVLTEGEFGKGIFVGSVLILHKVSVFSPSRSAHYLNITNRNLVKVFYNDSGSSQAQSFHGCRIIDAEPVSDSGRGIRMLHSTCSPERGAEGIANGIQLSTNSRQSSHIDDEQEKVNPIVSIGRKGINKRTNQTIASTKEMLRKTDFIRSCENDHTNFENASQPTKGGSLLGSINGDKNVEPAKVSGLLPVWTDEQLNELFDGDFGDDMAF